MTDLQRRPGAPMSRRQKRERAYQLTLATGALALLTVAGFILDLVGAIDSGTIPLIAAVLAVVSFVLLRRTISGR